MTTVTIGTDVATVVKVSTARVRCRFTLDLTQVGSLWCSPISNPQFLSLPPLFLFQPFSYCSITVYVDHIEYFFVPSNFLTNDEKDAVGDGRLRPGDLDQTTLSDVRRHLANWTKHTRYL